MVGSKPKEVEGLCAGVSRRRHVLIIHLDPERFSVGQGNGRWKLNLQIGLTGRALVVFNSTILNHRPVGRT